MAAQTGNTQQWLDRLAGSQQKHLERVRGLRGEIRRAEDMDPLDQAVLGITGSAEELTKYRELAQRVGASVGQPLIVIKKVGPEGRDTAQTVTEAKAGIIAGPLMASEVIFVCRQEGQTGLAAALATDRVTLAVPVEPVAAFLANGPGRWGGENGMYYGDDAEDERRVEVARLVSAEGSNQTSDPNKDFNSNIAIENVLVGSEAIFNSPFWGLGLQPIYLAVEARAREDARQSAATA